MSELLQELATGGREVVEYGLHVSWPPNENGRVVEDWMACPNEDVLRYRIKYWTERGLVCTPLVRTITTTGWQEAA